ncbi:MAG: bifunctional nuclease family protein [Alloprevotella sp.]|nr:bifunctional nuclease family protein [Alloprevotella sp.]
MTDPQETRIPLKVLGLSYREIQKGAYALILAEINGPHYIPIVIGAAEAQSIALRLERVKPPRPTTHDIFASFSHAFGIRLMEVYIYRYDEGLFTSELIFTAPDGHEVAMDARTSDAIAIAMRTGAPIYTTPEIIAETGFTMADAQQEVAESPDEEEEEGDAHMKKDSDPLDDLSLEELEERLCQLIADELYEEAAKVSAAIKARREQE